MDRVFLGFPPLPKALERISQFDDPQFDALRAEVRGADAFSIADSRVGRLAEALPSSNEAEIFDLLQALDFLYQRCREWETGDDERDFRVPLRAFLKTTQLWRSLGPDPNRSFERLAELVSPHADLEQKRKMRWLRTGILENAVEFSSFVDLRPDFSADRADVRGLVPAIVLRIRTESDFERDRAHIFQFSIDGLKKLRKALDDIDRKLSAVTSHDGLSRLLQKDGYDS